MNSRHSRTLLWSIITGVLIIALLYAFWPRAVITDIANLSRGDLRITITEEGKTRVRDVYVLSAPVAGYLRRIEAEVGDPVFHSKTVVASIEPIEPAFLDPRTEAQAKAEVEAAKSSTEFARASVDQAQAELEFAQGELGRMRDLRSNSSVSQRELDNAQRDYKTRRAALSTTQASLQMRLFELERAKAVLMSPATSPSIHGTCECVDILAPIDGRILKVLNENEGVVTAGTSLVEIGNPKNLEIVVELLSFDAVKTKPGQNVLITNWGGDYPLIGKVSLVEPIGFKKISALGIEEQRVNVIVNIQSDFSEWQRLGHGYQLDVDILLSESKDVLTVPITALFREQQKWAIYAVVDDQVEKRHLKLGNMNHLFAEVVSGLEENQAYVLHPNDQIVNGVRVSQRAENTD
jgi:HlyD family secretion protein